MSKPRAYILIFGHPRSGSTTLARALSLHPEIKVANEPFVGSTITSPADLDRRLEEITRQYNGIKHLCKKMWPFGSERVYEFNRHLLNKEGWLPVFLWRRNSFASAVSGAIAQQLRAWNTEDSKRLLGKLPALNPVPAEQVRDYIEALAREVPLYRGFLEESGRPFHEIVYEDFYEAAAPEDHGVDWINRIIRDAGYEPVRDPETIAAMKRLLSPDNKVNNRTTYDLIPNIDELVQEFVPHLAANGR